MLAVENVLLLGSKKMKKYLTKYEFRWAIIILMLSLLWTAFEYEMGWHDRNFVYHRYFTFLFIIPFTLSYWLFLLDKKSHRFKKKFRYRHAFNSGMGLTILVALFTIPTQFLIHYLVTPDYLTEAQNYSVKSGELTTIRARDLYTITNFVILFPILYLLLGILLSMIFGSTMTQKSSRR